MKLSLAILAAATPAMAFAPIHSVRQTVSISTRPIFAASPLEEVSDSSEESSDPYARIGVSKDQLAIGVDAKDFLQWIGTKQDLMDRFMRDNKGMDEARAEEEVSKFLMDAEMANAYIKFEQDKVLNPPNLKEEAEQSLADPKTIATYAAWLIGGGSFGYIRKEFIEPKYASGEWEEIHIALPFQDMIKPAAEKAAETAAEVATPVAKLSDSLIGAADAVHDSILTVMS
mmetsp:Transcript_122980/g.183972  ORF Transcript_122980/g.183972 Transcript_122980/m.183972 type:complete len:229 (-) Transcript_122980:69-755(-)|eukprot:CAMPEP_0117046952 /NCGR_PEP_ID=MMETSP0472-20121206/32454_1 /TAXON_ID=693140 ORGANISM="Tiarina fusus, Strain LIS" /NCGR_SAMPLE_ID=MMETSP0472 /ASSEMBLY_ACC=CAM_ASM_000603 /LENGTH=228 /DNA_ID=CAMNT_0004759479 /DNA_START=58 /DNA_END=744 /DNA_ORIENTATION=+